MARRLRCEVRQIRRWEQASEPPLAVVHQYSQVLGVPVGELLAEPADTSPLNLEQRMQGVKIMKTLRHLQGHIDTSRKQDQRVQRLMKMLEEQLLALWPEFAGVQPWPNIGQRRTTDELGRAARMLGKLPANSRYHSLYQEQELLHGR